MLSPVPTQKRVKLDALNYVVIYDLLFCIMMQGKLSNITPSILLVIPEILELVIVHMYHFSLLIYHQEAWKMFLTMSKNYFMYKMLAKYACL